MLARTLARALALAFCALLAIAPPRLGAAVVPGPQSNYNYPLGFDTGNAPSVAEMQYSWANYRYFYIGIYVSGANRGPQTYLSRDWVSQVYDIGFSFIPIDVGLQAPVGCELAGQTGWARMSADPGTAFNQGVQQAVTASANARDYGIDAPAPIYLDIEAYQTGNSVCRTAMLEFIRGWTIQIEQYEGRYSGAYGSTCGSGQADWASLDPVVDNIWMAQWNAPNENDPNISVWRVSCVPATSWSIQPPYGRLHQFWGDIQVWFGTRYLPIDQNCAWARLSGRSWGADPVFPNCPGSP